MEHNVRTKLENLNLVDKFLFDEAMEDRETYQAVVSILLEDEIELIERPHTQLDVSLLEPGSTDFNLLNDSCFILIAPFDLFGRGLYRYTFEGSCRECPDLRIGDGAVRIFINTEGKNQEDFSVEFLELMRYVKNTTDEVADASGSSKIRRIHQRIRKIKLSEKTGVKYMQRWEELAYARQDGITEGREEGEQVKLIKLICKKLLKNRTPEEICEDLEEEMGTIMPICELAREFAPEYDSEKVYEKLRNI